MPPIDLLKKITDPSQIFSEVTGLRDDTLGSPEAFKSERKETLDQSVGLPLADTDLKVGATISLALLNQAADEDKAKVFGPQRAPAPGFPVLAPGDKQAWLRYSLAIEASLGGAVPALPVLALDLGVSGEASYTAYQPHSTDTTLYAALRSDLSSFRPRLFDLDSFHEAKTGEVHGFEREGALAIGLRVNLVSFFPAALREFKLTLPAAAPKPLLAIAGALSAEISLGAKIADSFAIYLARTGADAYQLQVKRARTRGLSVGVKIGADISLETASLNDLPAVKNFEEQVLVRLLDGVTAEEVANLRAHLLGSPAAALPAELQAVADKALASLDKYIPKLVKRTLADLVPDIEGQLQALRDSLQKSLKTEISFGLGLAWSRVETNETLLQATHTQAEIKTHGRDLLLGNFDPLRAFLAARPRPATGQPVFLETEILAKAATLSFGIELGSFALKTTRKRETNRTVVTDLEGRVKPAYSFDLTQIEGSGFERNTACAGLVSTLLEFDQADTIQARQFAHTLQLALAYNDGERWVSDLDVLEYLDTAALWGGLSEDPSELRQTLQDIRAWHRGVGGPLSLRVNLTAEPEALSQLWSRQIMPADFAQALAAASGPGDPSEPKHAALGGIAARTSLLEPIWKDVLALPSANYRFLRDRWDFASEVGKIARKHLGASPIPAVRLLAGLQQTNYFAGTSGPHGNPPARPRPEGHDLSTLVFALPLGQTNWLTRLDWLREAGYDLARSESYEYEKVINDSLTDFIPLRAHAFYARAYGRALRQIEKSLGLAKPLLKVTLSAEAGKTKRSTLAIA